MRLLVDAQCVQSSSSMRGIGRYALSLLQGLVETAGDHRVEVLLNGGDDPQRLLRARAALESFLPPAAVHVFDAPWAWTPPYDDRRRPLAEAAYTASVRSLRPDALLVGSPFEGDGETVLAVGASPLDPPCAAVLYDLIPALDPATYLMGPGAEAYWRRFEQLKRCGALLAISEHSGRQAVDLLGQECPPVTPVWGGPYPSGAFPAFEPQHDDSADVRVPDRFLLSVGGDHPRKNLDRLVTAWSLVPQPLREATPLVLACRLNPGTVRRLRRGARRAGVGPAELVLTGGVSEATLHALYTRAHAFVFPSVEEGLGMPPLEAMAVGCPTLLARGSSLDELCDEPAAFFDGFDVTAMGAALRRVLTDDALRDALCAAAAISSQRFTWRHSAELAWRALEQLPPASPPQPAAVVTVRLSRLAGPEGVAALAGPAPHAVVLDAALADGGAGVLGLPVAARAAVAGASALLAPDEKAARAAVRAGLLDSAVVVGEDALRQVAAHDVLGEHAAGLAALSVPPDLVDRVVTAAASPARWTLERPRPVWLLLSDAPVEPSLPDLAAEAGIDLVPARLDAAGLARAADAVLVDATAVAARTAPLSAARRSGARVVAVQTDGDEHILPSWCERLVLDGPLTSSAAWEPRLAGAAQRFGRTTGWPWRDPA